jgi:lysophospholipase L1-like esterase
MIVNPFEFVNVDQLIDESTNAPKPNSLFADMFNDPFRPDNAKILFLGDSNTYDNASSWVGILKRKIGIKRSKVIQKNGSTTTWMKEQLQSDLAKGNKYHWVFIWGGINDIYTTGTKAGKDKAIQNIKSMISMVRKAKSPEGYTPRIVVINIACDRLRDTTVRYATNEKLSDEFARDVNKLLYASIVDTRYLLSSNNLPCNALSERQLSQLRSNYCQDNLCHLNAKGNQVLADYIDRNVFKYIR